LKDYVSLCLQGESTLEMRYEIILGQKFRKINSAHILLDEIEMAAI
jgi:hypothetical protein